jgi:hypothetical protein
LWAAPGAVLASWLIWAGLDNEFKARIPIMGWDHQHLLKPPADE